MVSAAVGAALGAENGRDAVVAAGDELQRVGDGDGGVARPLRGNGAGGGGLGGVVREKTGGEEKGGEKDWLEFHGEEKEQVEGKKRLEVDARSLFVPKAGLFRTADDP